MNASMKLSDNQKSALYWTAHRGGTIASTSHIHASTALSLFSRGFTERGQVMHETETGFIYFYQVNRLTTKAYQFLSDNGSLGQYEQVADELTAIAFIDAFFNIIPAQPDYASMSMGELLDYPDGAILMNEDIHEAIEGITRWDVESVSDDELRKGVDKLTGYIWAEAIVKRINRELERRDDALRCKNCNQYLDVCEANGHWTPGSIYEAPEWVCGYEPDYDAKHDAR